MKVSASIEGGFFKPLSFYHKYIIFLIFLADLYDH